MNRKRIIILAIFALFVVFFTIFIGYVGNQSRDIQKRIRIDQMQGESRKLRDAITNYANAFGRIPTGENSAIIGALMRGNSAKIIFLKPDADRVDSASRYLDYWGTPYQLEVTETNLTLSSAGWNRAFGDKDDLATQQSLVPVPAH